MPSSEAFEDKEIRIKEKGMTERKDKNVGEMTYKEASTELELIIRSLESGDMELEESLESYARGVELLRSLRSRLADAEQKVSVLLKDIDGADELVPASSADDADDLKLS